MGYSLAVPIKSEKAKKKMLAFLAKHFDNLGVPMRGPLGSAMSYDAGPCRIGFDQTITSLYSVSLCAWIALKVGRVQVFPTKNCPRAAGPHKYLVYDGQEIWPLLISTADSGEYTRVNWVGCIAPELAPYAGKKNKKLREIYTELKRLNALWQEEA